MGTLFLPSLRDRKFFEINDVTQEEAIDFCAQFTEAVKDNRKIKDVGDYDKEMQFFINMLTEPYVVSAEDIKDVFGISETRRVRGARAVFFDADENVVGVGSTVVYNANWATVNFSDNSLLTLLADNFDINEDIDDDEEEEEEEEFDGDTGRYRW